MKTFQILFSLSLLWTPARAWSQDDSAGDAEEVNIIEVEIDREATPPPPTVEERPATTPVEPPKPIDFSGLGQLSPFKEVSVIQKRYLPKTGRFELFGGLTLITNDPFFNSIGGVVKAGYFFTESLGLELNYFGLSTSPAKSTKELETIHGVTTASFVQTKGAMAVDLMWVPIYGKISWFNEKIVPFDLYLSAGYGSTKTDVENAGTLHLATGQMFALSKGTAFRWDFSWNFFNATGVDGKLGSYNNLFLSMGASWFFPEAKYR